VGFGPPLGDTLLMPTQESSAAASHACRGCSMVADQVAHVAHLDARDTTLALVSRAPQADIARG